MQYDSYYDVESFPARLPRNVMSQTNGPPHPPPWLTRLHVAKMAKNVTKILSVMFCMYYK